MRGGIAYFWSALQKSILLDSRVYHVFQNANGVNMSKPKRKKRKHPQKPLTLEQRLQQAQRSLQNEHFSNALTQLKELWKIEQSESIRDALLIAV